MPETIAKRLEFCGDCDMKIAIRSVLVRCLVCGHKTLVTMTCPELSLYRAEDSSIQDIFPTWSERDRDVLRGFCTECQDLFSQIEEGCLNE